jgi:hypothetical protein
VRARRRRQTCGRDGCRERLPYDALRAH